MSSLHELQADFKNAMLSQADHGLDQAIIQNKLTTDQRLNVYRNNVFQTLISTLQSLYPTILSIVGEDFFNASAKQFTTQNFSTSGNLAAYGKQFGEFLADFSPAQELPYIKEVAALEWAYHTVFHEVDPIALDFSRLKHIPAENYHYIRFKLTPTIQLFDFQYPILAIWNLCHGEDRNKESVDLAMGGEKVLVIRRRLEITFEKLSPGQFAFLSGFNEDMTFEAVCEQTLQTDPEFAVSTYLQECLLQGIISDFIL